MRLFTVAVILGLVAGTPAEARKTIFVPHGGPPLILQGQGGTRTINHGVELWSGGMPARRFQVIGSIADERTDRVWDGTVGASRAIADKVRAVGGDAIVVGSRTLTPVGRIGGRTGGVFGTPAFSSHGPMIVNDVVTRLLVIKYR